MCEICADERQWVPAAGQQWTTLEELHTADRKMALEELEPDLFGITVDPEVGIGQRSLLVRTPAGNLLWDPTGYLDDDTARRVRDLGPVVAIAASHPHMFGVQVEWSRALGGVPVLVAEADARWLARPDAAVRYWSDVVEVVPGVTLHQLGGHFPGSAVAHWPAGAGGAGALLAGDTISPNPDRATVSFMRSYPNRIPLSGAVVERLARGRRAARLRPALRQLRRRRPRRRQGRGAVLGRPARRVGQRRARRRDLRPARQRYGGACANPPEPAAVRAHWAADTTAGRTHRAR